MAKQGSVPNLPPLNEASEIRKQMSGIAAPCHTELTPNMPQAVPSDIKKAGQDEDDLMSLT